MKFAVLLTIVCLANCLPSSPAAPIRLEGEAFHPSAPITWAATNTLPPYATVYRVAPTSLSQAVISNAMAVASFKPIDRTRNADKATMLFQYNPDGMHMKRFLKAIPSQGWMDFYNQEANQASGVGVPTFDEAEKLALDYFQRFGGQTNQIAPKPWRRTDETVTSFDHKGGQETNKVVSMRGVFFFRQIDGIRDTTSSFSIAFAKDAKPFKFNFNWPVLQPIKKYKAATKTELMKWIKDGLAVRPKLPFDVPPVPLSAKTFRITKVEFYYTAPLGTNHDLIPFAHLEVVPECGGTNAPSLFLQCPIIDGSSEK